MAKKRARSLFAIGMSRAIKLIFQFIVVVAFWFALVMIFVHHLSKFKF